MRIHSVKSSYAVAQLVSLLSASSERATPFCSVFGACGGCQVQHLAYPAQLVWKADLVRNALVRLGGFDEIAVRRCVGMTHPRAYRNKMSLVVDRARGLPAVGFYQQRSHQVVPIDACPIVAPQLNEYIVALNILRRMPELNDLFHEARHIVARSARATGEAVVTVTTARESEHVQHAAPLLLAQFPGAVGMVNSYEPNSQNAILGRKSTTVAGRSEIEERIGEIRYRVSAQSFFQVNPEMVGRIFNAMLGGLASERKIVDLYCGAGTFSLFFAKFGAHVLGIEENAQAVLEAQHNAKLNALTERVSFRAGRVEDEVRTPDVQAALADADIVFLDPPRKGSDEQTLAAIASSGVRFIWYLSCDPATLARDLKMLCANGYRLGIVQPFDMFPQTGHVETLVTLYRADDLPEDAVDEAFLNVPPPEEWPKNEFTNNEPEYPDFVIR